MIIYLHVTSPLQAHGEITEIYLNVTAPPQALWDLSVTAPLHVHDETTYPTTASSW